MSGREWRHDENLEGLIASVLLQFAGCSDDALLPLRFVLGQVGRDRDFPIPPEIDELIPEWESAGWLRAGCQEAFGYIAASD